MHEIQQQWIAGFGISVSVATLILQDPQVHRLYQASHETCCTTAK